MKSMKRIAKGGKTLFAGMLSVAMIVQSVPVMATENEEAGEKLPEVVTESTQEVTAEPTPEVKTEATPQVTTEPTPGSNGRAYAGRDRTAGKRRK